MSDTEILAAAIDRLAAAIEQAVLSTLDKHDDGEMLPPFDAPLPPPPPEYQPQYQPQYAPPPAQHYQPPMGADPNRPPQAQCPQHGWSWKFVPAGTSKKTGQSYAAFWGCNDRNCRNRP